MIFFDIHKTLSYDPLNPEHEATCRVSWVNSTGCICISTFSARGLRTSSRYDSSKKDNITIMLSCFLTNNIELSNSDFSNLLHKKQMTKHAEIAQRYSK
jgi:hypothetical protein